MRKKPKYNPDPIPIQMEKILNQCKRATGEEITDDLDYLMKDINFADHFLAELNIKDPSAIIFNPNGDADILYNEPFMDPSINIR